MTQEVKSTAQSMRPGDDHERGEAAAAAGQTP